MVAPVWVLYPACVVHVKGVGRQNSLSYVEEGPVFFTGLVPSMSRGCLCCRQRLNQKTVSGAGLPGSTFENHSVCYPVVLLLVSAQKSMPL